MNQERFLFSIAYDDRQKYIYVFGGRASEGFINHCEKYNVLTDTWTVIKPMVKGKANMTACILNNEFIFIFGGKEMYILNGIEKYSIVKDTWEFVQI